MNEQPLIYALIRKSLKSGQDKKDAAAWLDGATDWEYLWQIAHKQNVVPMVANGLLELKPQNVPDDVLGKCREILASAVYRNVYMKQQLEQVEQLLAQHDIPTLAFKGPRFTETYYGNIALRRSCDLDLLVRPDQRDAACSVLKENAFTIFKQHAEASPFISFIAHPYERICKRDKPPLMVEIHWALGDVCYHVLDTDDVWEGLKRGNAASLNDEQIFLLYCGHALGHRWFPMNHICHIAAIIQSAGKQMDWALVMRLADKKHKRRNVLLGFSLAHALFQVDVPVPFTAEVSNRNDVQHLTKRVIQILEQNTDKIGYLTAFVLKFLIMESIKDRSYLLVRSFGRVLSHMRQFRTKELLCKSTD